MSIQALKYFVTLYESKDYIKLDMKIMIPY